MSENEEPTERLELIFENMRKKDLINKILERARVSNKLISIQELGNGEEYQYIKCEDETEWKKNLEQYSCRKLGLILSRYFYEQDNAMKELLAEDARHKSELKEQNLSKYLMESRITEEPDQPISTGVQNNWFRKNNPEECCVAIQPTREQFVLKLPTFSGRDNDDINEWIQIVETAAELNGISASNLIIHIAGRLRGEALAIFQEFRLRNLNNYKNKWLDFAKELQTRFVERDINYKTRKELENLNSEIGIRKFINKFEELVRKTNLKRNEEEVLFLFLEKLPKKVKYEIRLKKPKTIDEAITLALTFDDMYPENNNNINNFKKINYSKTQFPQRGKWKKGFLKKNGYEKKFDRNGEKKPYPNQEKKEYKNNDIICRRCKKKGHIAKNCRVKINSAIVQGENYALREEECEVQTNMAKVLSVESHGLLTIDACVNGIALKAALDSGATSSIISKRIIERYKEAFKIKATQLKVKTANNEINQALGIIENAEIEIGGHVCKLDIIIMNHDDNDMLLGIDWFKQTGAGLFPLEKILKFPSAKIELREEKEINEYEDQVLISEVETKFLSKNELGDDSDIEEDNWEFSKDYLPKEDLSKHSDKNRGKILAFLKRTKELWRKVSATKPEELGASKVPKFSIIVKKTPPIFIPPHRRSIAEEKKLADEVKLMLDANIIEKSSSEWNFPIFLVKKKDGSMRPVIDYRQLNAITITEPFPMPNPDDIFDRLAHSTWYAGADMTSGYWQMEIDKESRKYTAFSTREGHFQFKRVPFGLKNAPAAFNRMMKVVLGHLNFLEVYLDDITIHSKNIDEHLKNIEELLLALIEKNLKIKPSKCEWFTKEVKLLGHIISGTEKRMDPAKTKAIKERERPRSVKEIQQFLGICNYYRKFVKDYAKIAQPLFTLVKKDKEFTWEKDQEESFQELKRRLVQEPILRQPDFTKQFTIFTDASNYALGAVLTQLDNDSREYVICYASRLMKGPELNYTITEKECLAVVWAVKQFKYYLFGAEFKIVTDHSALAWLMGIREPTGRLARWAIYLQAYSFTLIHRKGLIHSNADTLSRPPIKVDLSVLIEEDSSKNIDPYEDEHLLYYLKNKKHNSGITKKQVKRIEKHKDVYELVDDQLLYKGKIVPRANERLEIVEKAHLMGHFQKESTLNRIKEKYYWPNMIKLVEHVIENCEQCIRHEKVKRIEHPAKSLEATGILDRIGIDLVKGLPETEEGYNGILVITDGFSKYPWIAPIKTKKAEEIAEKLGEYISIFGPPKVILSDQGTEFCNEIVRNYITSLGVEHKVTSAYHPRTNGQTERLNGVFINSLKKHAEDRPHEWHKWLPFVSLAYRTKKHDTTGYTPFYLMFGREPNQFEDWQINNNEIEKKQIENRIEEINQREEIGIKNAKENIEENQTRQRRGQEKGKRIEKDSLREGTEVYVRREGILGKLEQRYDGPYEVAKEDDNQTYKLRNELGEVMQDKFPRERLKKVTKKRQEYFEVEKIIDHKINDNGEYDYFVKWKNYDDKDNSWVKTDNFNGKKMIAAYWKDKENLKKKTNIEKNVTSSRKLRSHNANYLMIAIIIGIIIESAFGVTIKDKFYLCDKVRPEQLHMMPILSPEDECIVKDSEPAKILQNKTTIKNVHVLTKLGHQVEGYAHSCYKELIVVNSTQTFFGADKVTFEKKTIRLTAAECATMKETKKCGDFEMTCDENTCYYDGTPKPQYHWLQHYSEIGSRCILKRKHFVASTPGSNLFGLNCSAHKLSCTVGAETYIWDSNSISKCPYHYITTINELKHDEADYLSDTKTGALYKVKENVKICNNILAYSTVEGVYLTTNNEVKKLNFSIASDLTAIHDLTLAEEDGVKYSTIKLQKKQYLTNCDNLKNELRRVIASADNEYVKFSYPGMEPIIGYVSDGIVVLPKCIKVPEVEILNNITQCYKGFKVKIKIPMKNKVKRETTISNNTESENVVYNITKKPIVKYINYDPSKVEEREVFLIKDNILVRALEESNCNKSVYLAFPKKNLILTRIGSQIYFTGSEHIIKLSEFLPNIKKYTFSHYEYIKENIDLTVEILNNINIEETHEEIFYSNATFNKVFIEKGGGIVKTLKEKLYSFINNTILSVKTILFFAIIFLICVITIYVLIITIRRKIRDYFKQKSKNNISVRFNPQTDVVSLASAPNKI